MVGYVYRITNIQTQKKYIGITENFERRKKKHIKELKNIILIMMVTIVILVVVFLIGSKKLKMKI